MHDKKISRLAKVIKRDVKLKNARSSSIPLVAPAAVKKSVVKTKKPAGGASRADLLAAGKKLIKMGFSIVALEPADTSRPGSGKRPITPNGVKDATNDFLKFKEQVKGRDNFNIGIATNNLVVIDIDPRNGGLRGLKKLKKELGPLTGPKVRTGGGGLHYYYLAPKGQEIRCGVLEPGVDIKARCGYVVAPGSAHSSGKPYAWIDGRSPNDKKIRPLPEKWLAAILQRRERKKSAASETTSAITTSTDTIIPEGRRNDTLTSIAGKLRAQGRDVAAIEAELQQINKERCHPQLDEQEVSRIAKSSERWVAGVGEPSVSERVVQHLLEAHFANSNHLRYERDQEFYEFTSTHWRPIPRKVLQKQVLAIIRNLFPGERKRITALANEVMNLLEIETSDAVDALHFEAKPPPVLNLLNGELWLRDDGTVELKPHRPETGLRHVLPVMYDAAATCPEYDNAVAEIFSKGDDPDRMLKVWHQLVGYVIQPSRNRPTIVILEGPGGDGKTKLVLTIAQLLGPNAVYSSDVSQLEASKFGIGGLVGKFLFIDDDVNAGAKLPDGTLKRISEGKTLTGERKHKDPFDFVCRTIPFLLCNNTPLINDLSKGFRRRLKVFTLTREFSEKEQDKMLFNRIWANELSGVLNHALQGWREFVANGHEFSASSDLNRGMTKLLAKANPLAAYIEERCEKKSDAAVGLNALYTDYTTWSTEAGYNHPLVRHKLKGLLVGLGYKTKTVQGYTHVCGLKLRSGGVQP